MTRLTLALYRALVILERAACARKSHEVRAFVVWGIGR